MKKLFKYFFGFLIFLIVAAGVGCLVLNKSLPEGEEGAEAEQLADKMLKAVNAEAWESVQFLEWDYPRGHHHFWDRNRNLVEVTWDGYRVLVDPDSKTGTAFLDGKKLSGEEHKAKVEKAIHYFWNDSFWLIGYLKVRDPGTTRKVVELDEGEKALLVTYDSGGTTPGDSYLWFLDENGRPYAWQMWVNLIPLGGLQFSWEDWYALPNGAMVATTHRGLAFSIEILDLKTGTTMAEMGRNSDIFADFPQ